MEELEKMQRAKMYMDKLADGINPLNDQPVGEAELLNNVKLTRCFFYVSDVLRQVIENGGVGRKAKRKKELFHISDEELNNFEYSDTPISITHVVRRINDLINQNEVRKLSYKLVVNWLKTAGLLEDANGRYANAKTCPTEMGKQMGISIEKRVGAYREYFLTCYDRNAQEFIVNHVQFIMSGK